MSTLIDLRKKNRFIRFHLIHLFCSVSFK